jgi:hypothetical protein
MIEEDYDKFADHMTEKYPKIFSKPYGGFCIGPGWWPIVEKLCDQIQHHIDWNNKNAVAGYKDFQPIEQVVVDQIKEKFGGLRFYYQGGDNYIRGLVSMAESWAWHSCEECGVPGKSRGGGWIKTLCDEHDKERQLKYEQYAKQNGLEL